MDEATRKRRTATKESLLADIDGLVSKLMQDAVDRVPHFATQEPRQRTESELIVRWAVTRGIERWVDNERITDEDLEIVRSIAVARAQEGQPLDAMLRASSSGPRSLLEVVQSETSSELTTDDVADLALLTMDTIDRSTGVFEAAYTAAARRLAEDGEGARNLLVLDILRGRPSSHAMFVERAEGIGLVLPSDPAVLTLAATRIPLGPPDAADVAHLVEAARDRGPQDTGRPVGPGEALLHVTQGDASVVVGPAARIGSVAARAAAQGWYAAVAPAPDWSIAAERYRRSRFAIRSAPEWAFAGRRHLTFPDIEVLEVLNGAAARSAQEIARDVLGDLLVAENAFLRETLEVYLAHGNAPRAAELLQIHAQTLRYRLKQIQELTGRDTRSEWDRFVLQVASTALPWSRS